MSINLTDELNAATKKGKIAAAKQVFLDGDSQTVQKEIEDINARHDSLNSKHDELNATVSEHTTQIANNQSQITANKSAQDAKNASLDANMAKLNTRDDQITELVKGVTATGGASVATTVSYDNTSSNLDAATAQGAIDELATKKLNKTDIVQELGDAEDKVVSQFALPFREVENPEFIHCVVDSDNRFLFGIQFDGSVEWAKGIPAPVREKFEEVVSQSAQDKSDLLGMLNKTAVKDEDGNVVDTPFRYIQSEEFIFAQVDANDKLLFGIQQDGTPVFGKASSVEDELQSQVAILAEKVTAILGDEDSTSVIDTMKELKDFFANIENTESLAAILADLDKVAIKDETGAIQESPFRVIENDEWLYAMVDADNKVVYGVYRNTGKPYYPLNEMYHVEQNEEFFAVWLDADDKVVLGIRRDGEIIGEIHAVNALKQVISQLQEKVDTIYYNTKDFLNFLSLQENQEYLAVETDADGKILSATNTDGSHYIHNVKSETIPEELFHIEDIEERTEITTDANDKILSYRDSEGKKHENSMEIANLDVSNINLQGNSVNNIEDALKANGFDVKHPTDWSDKSFIQIPEPHFAIINISNIDSMPTSKTQNKKAFLEFWDMQGNYFKKHAILNAQGNSSMTHYKKNIAVDFCEDEWVGDDTTSVKIGNWIVQDSFHLKAFYCSFYKNECPVSYKIWDRMCHTYKFTEDRPYKDYLASKFPDKGANVTNSNFGQNNAFEARCVPDGFPCAVYLNNTFWGIYSFQLKKHRDNYFMDKESTKNIHLDGDSYLNLFNGIVDWNLMEIRNPKPKKWKLYDMDGNKYDGDSPKELMGKYLSDGETVNPNYDENNESHKKSAEVKQNIVALSNYMKDLKVYENAYNEAVKNKSGEEEALATLKREIEKRFGVKWIMDYILIMCLLQDSDSINKNTQWTTWGAVDSLLRWNPNPYDMDAAFGCDSTIGFTNQMAIETTLGKNTNTPYSYIWKYYLDDMKKRYAELRQKGIFSYNVIFKEYLDWVNRVGSEYYKLEVKKWGESPSNRNSLLNTDWELTGLNYITFSDSATNWSNAKSYKKGNLIKFERKVYKSIVDNNINHLPTEDSSEWWELVSVQAKTYNAGDTVYDGYSNFFQFKVPDGKSIRVTISEDSSRSDKLLNTPFTGFYENYPHEGGRYDSIFRISKWIERKIELMDSQMEYNV